MNDSILKTLLVAFVVCLVCSLVVSVSAVSLRDTQRENALNDQRIKILKAAGLYNATINIKDEFNKLDAFFINFNTGEMLKEFEDLDINTYDQIASTRSSELSSPVPTSEDIAIIKNRENIGKFYILRNNDNSINKLILPVRGFGLWGTMYGYISVENDFNTVSGLEFYDHKETPGLGAEIENPKWKSLWKGKKIYKNNKVQLSVIKGKVASDDNMSLYKVDGLSGATLTSRGVTNMISYWFSESGYSKLFQNLNYET